MADTACSEIWVAAGVYYPDEGAGQTNDDRNSTFRLKSGVALYGGFAGTETARNQRDPAANITVLSGDIDKNDTTDANGVVTDTANIQGNNAYHVVTGDGVDNTAVLDGFVVTGGKAEGSNPNHLGGGMFNSNSSNPTLANLTFSGNLAVIGGGMYNFQGSNPTLNNIIFDSNTADIGGGMYNYQGSNATLTNVVFRDNTANSFGGGMWNGTNSHATLINVTFTRNSAAIAGGGMENAPDGNSLLVDVSFVANSSTYGGGLRNILGSATITGTTFFSNTATNDGGAMANYTSTVTITNTTFLTNTATNDGGAMANYTSTVTISNTAFRGNTANQNGGGMLNDNSSPTLTNVTFSANSANFLGGGMYNNNSSPTLTDVTFSGNSATFGGGMNNNPNSSPILTNVTFAGNSATNGGGMENVDNSNPTLVNVTFSGNTASGSGGGLTAWNSTPSLTNVTFSANSAQYGGGMLNYNSSSTLTNVTFSGNSATTAGGGMLNDNGSSPTLTNVIIANSTAGGDCVNVNGSSIAPSSANNIIEDSTNACDLTNGVNGNIIGVDPNLGALTDFGSPGKQVFPLLSGSPAIDAGTNTGCPATDQRSAARPTDGNGDGTATCDIGAYETDAAALVTPGVGGGDGPGGVGITNGSSSLELWLKADAGVTTSGSSVSTWADQSGHGADVTQGSATSQPTHVTSLASLNNQPAVQFDGSNDYLNIPASVIEGKTAFSFFTAFQWNGGNAWQRLWDFGSNTTYNGFVTTRNDTTNTPRFAITTSGQPNEERLTFNNALPANSGQIVDIVWGVPNGEGWRNGASEASGSGYTLTPQDVGTISQHYIGKSIYTVDPYLNAYIGDYIVFSAALNDTERILVENYLSAKYNVALSANDVYDGDDNANGDFDLDVAGIGQYGGNKHTQAHAAGMIVVDRTFLNDDGDWLLFGHNVAANSNVTTDLPTTGDWATAPTPQRWARSFYIDVTDNTAGVDCATPGTCLVDIIFDFSEGGMGNGKSPAGPASNYRLLKRTGTTGQFSDIATATAIVGDQVQFLGVDVSLLGSNFTLGTLDAGTSPTAVTLNDFEAHVTGASNTWPLVGMSAVLLGVVSLALVRKRRQ
ncbi:hypothetical protein ARMA_1874 [Ardenticatena maritima]|uniref:Right handed beta helix domain-containing protein n=1 Tax=Ardenticatena maritima TaxID=872965 RepID=A0A0M8K988_9CHLR|nr:hypothetical protein ARMA_1874 [Ardenticatena maritima]